MQYPPDSVLHAAERAASAASSVPPYTGATYLLSLAGAASAVAKIDLMAVAGIALAVCTFVANQVWAWVRNRREARAALLQLEIDEMKLQELRRLASKEAL